MRVVAAWARRAPVAVASSAADPPPGPAGRPGPGRRDAQFTSCGLTPQAARTECATADLPLDYSTRTGRRCTSRSPATPRRGHRQGVLFFNFGGPGGAPSCTPGARCEHALACAQRAFRHHRLRSARLGQSTPGIDCKDERGDGGHLRAAVHDAVQRRPERPGREGQATSSSASATTATSWSTSRPRTSRGTWIRSGRCSARQAELLGFSYGTFLGATYANLFPKNYRAHGARRPDRRRRRTSTSRGATWPSRRRGSSGRAGASSRRAPRPGRVRGLRRQRPVGRATTSSSSRPNAHGDPGRRLRVRPAAGGRRRHQLGRRRRRSTRRSSGASSPRRSRRRRPATARSSATSSTAATAATTTGRTPRARSVLHDRGDRAALSARTSTSTSTVATRPGARSTTTTGTTATRS